MSNMGMFLGMGMLHYDPVEHLAKVVWYVSEWLQRVCFKVNRKKK